MRSEALYKSQSATNAGIRNYEGGVSKCGDALLRTMLYEAAHVLLTRGAKCTPSPGHHPYRNPSTS